MLPIYFKSQKQALFVEMSFNSSLENTLCLFVMPTSPATIPQQYVNTSKQTHTNRPT